jgi:molybdopterin-guanine dinucleotide biosynthesis protein A
VRVIRRDRVARCGPLGGIYTGLLTSGAQGELFLACDMPFVSVALLNKLAKRFSRTGQPIFTQFGRRRSGFPCVLHRAQIVPIERLIKAGRFSLQALASTLAKVSVRARPEELLNLNNPADLEVARQKLRECRHFQSSGVSTTEVRNSRKPRQRKSGKN